ncbi:aquaporin-5-like isoform X2 [Rhineura floridana]|uniref:aquaporin-5-like isoform X2 n=1 Tax=Rhineura floridana TaxID=261503 RepID=UPI002AC82872|nr:aquaporin-5-like isoform X2 [Rhineura floridana]
MAAAPQRRQELCTVSFAKAVVCEFVATILFIFIALGAAFRWPLQLPSILQISVAFSLTIATLVEVFGPITGANINPAVTIAFFVANQISVIRLVFYVVVQLLGAIIGAGMIYAVTPRDIRRTLALNDLADGTTPGEALVVEIILTFTVVMCIFSATDKRRRDDRGNAPLTIGLAFGMAHLTGIYYTGCSLNPARSFGPAVIMGKFSGAHWVFWVGPILGASVAAVVYNYLLYPHRLSMRERLAIVQGFILPEGERRETPDSERRWT